MPAHATQTLYVAVFEFTAIETPAALTAAHVRAVFVERLGLAAAPADRVVVTVTSLGSARRHLQSSEDAPAEGHEQFLVGVQLRSESLAASAALCATLHLQFGTPMLTASALQLGGIPDAAVSTVLADCSHTPVTTPRPQPPASPSAPPAPPGAPPPTAPPPRSGSSDLQWRLIVALVCGWLALIALLFYCWRVRTLRREQVLKVQPASYGGYEERGHLGHRARVGLETEGGARPYSNAMSSYESGRFLRDDWRHSYTSR